jgi:membrane-bound acyltransferase YfiQ involved in biofilm formation
MGDTVFPLLILLYKIVVFSGFIAAWYGSDRLVRWCMKRPWFVWLSAFSFIIYALHAPLVAYAINAIFPLVQHVYEYRLFTYLFLPVGLLVFCAGAGMMLRGIFPKLYAVLTGGRGF